MNEYEHTNNMISCEFSYDFKGVTHKTMVLLDKFNFSYLTIKLEPDDNLDDLREIMYGKEKAAMLKEELKHMNAHQIIGLKVECEINPKAPINKNFLEFMNHYPSHIDQDAYYNGEGEIFSPPIHIIQKLDKHTFLYKDFIFRNEFINDIIKLNGYCSSRVML